MSMDVPTTNVTVTLSVPAEKITAAAMNVMEDYVPIVEDAVEEMKRELITNPDYQRVIKENLKEKLKKMITQEIERRIREAVNTVYYEKFGMIECSVRKILADTEKM